MWRRPAPWPSSSWEILKKWENYEILYRRKVFLCNSLSAVCGRIAITNNLVGASIARPRRKMLQIRRDPVQIRRIYVPDGQHPRVASLALRAIHLLAAPTMDFSNSPINRNLPGSGGLGNYISDTIKIRPVQKTQVGFAVFMSFFCPGG